MRLHPRCFAVLGLMASLSFSGSGCGRKVAPSGPTLIRLIHGLTDAGVRKSPYLGKRTADLSEALYPVYSSSLQDFGIGENALALKRKIKLGTSESNILFSPPESEYAIETGIPAGAVLDFGIGIVRDEHSEARANGRLPAGSNGSEGVNFFVAIEINGRKRTLYQKFLALPPVHTERTVNFVQQRIDLPADERKARIILRTTGPEGSFAIWSNLILHAPSSSKPNVIFISIDTLRADHLGGYGYGRQTSPAMDALARDGTLFLNTYASAPWTLPSHVSMLTGLDGRNHQVYSADERMPLSLVTLSDVLGSQGYLCSAFTGGGFVSGAYGFSRGFDTYDESVGQFSLKDSAEKVSEAASGWLAMNRDVPFFLFLHTYQTHHPYASPEPFGTMFLESDDPWKEFVFVKYFGAKSGVFKPMTERERRNIIALYDGEIRYTDEKLVGPLMATLRRLGLYDRTMIVLTSDHGEAFFDHRGWGHGQDLYNEALRVPLIIKFPGSKYSGRKLNGIVRSIDIMPTILEELGSSFPVQELDGRSLHPVLAGREQGDRTFLSETCWLLQNGCEVIEPNGLVSHAPQKSAINAGPWKLVVNKPLGQADIASYSVPPPAETPMELYDVHADPAERSNLAPRNPAIVHKLMVRLQSLYAGARKMDVGKSKMSKALENQLRALGYIR
jgi:arylsulfatase A-like enzyme